MKATTTIRLMRCEQALINRLFLKGWTKALRASDDPGAGMAEMHVLAGLGATERQRDRVIATVAHAAGGYQNEPFWWRRQAGPVGPLMSAAVDAMRAYWKAHPAEAPPEPGFTVNIGDEPDDVDAVDIGAEPDGAEMEESTPEPAAEPEPTFAEVDVVSPEPAPEPMWSRAPMSPGIW